MVACLHAKCGTKSSSIKQVYKFLQFEAYATDAGVATNLYFLLMAKVENFVHFWLERISISVTNLYANANFQSENC